MPGRLSLLALLPFLLAATPAAAVTAAEKMETCKVGADSQKLAGAKRDAFVKRCMAKGNYEPAARKKAAQPQPKPKQ